MEEETYGYFEVPSEIPKLKIKFGNKATGIICIWQKEFKWWKRLYIIVTNPFRYVFTGKWYL